MPAKSNNELTLDTLCDASYQAAHWAKAHPDTAGYHQKKLEIASRSCSTSASPRLPARPSAATPTETSLPYTASPTPP